MTLELITGAPKKNSQGFFFFFPGWQSYCSTPSRTNSPRPYCSLEEPPPHGASLPPATKTPLTRLRPSDSSLLVTKEGCGHAKIIKTKKKMVLIFHSPFFLCLTNEFKMIWKKKSRSCSVVLTTGKHEQLLSTYLMSTAFFSRHEFSEMKLSGFSVAWRRAKLEEEKQNSSKLIHRLPFCEMSLFCPYFLHSGVDFFLFFGGSLPLCCFDIIGAFLLLW